MRQAVTGSSAGNAASKPGPSRHDPMRWPGDPTHYYVAPGLVAATATSPDGSVEVYVGSRYRSALRPLHDPGFTWEQFDGGASPPRGCQEPMGVVVVPLAVVMRTSVLSAGTSAAFRPASCH